jgi:hypothetical protein
MRKGMRPSIKRDLAARLALAFFVICLTNCHRRPQETGAAGIEAGEPEIYRATVVHTAVDGAVRETATSSVARRGDWRREEWMEAGGTRALIRRPDLGKSYLLDLGHHVYVEFDSAGGALNDAGRDTVAAPAGEGAAPAAITAEEVDRAVNDAPAPVQVVNRVLAEQAIEGHSCQVIERRATFADGRVEITRSHRARDLGGLPLLVEVESADGARLTVERRDVRLDVSPDDFAVPAGFRKVDRLSATPK